MRIPRTLPVPSNRAVRATAVIAVGVGASMLVWLVWTILSLSTDLHSTDSRLDQAQTERSALAATNDAQDKALAEANKRLMQVGQAPVSTPTLPVTTPHDGKDATDAQVAAQVALWMDAHPPAAGKNGTSPSAASVAAALKPTITAWLAAHPAPAGKDGINGTDGKNGTDGATGATGPGPTDAQVAAAVKAICDTGICTGAKGEPGKNAYPFTVTWAYPIPGNQTITVTCAVIDPAVLTNCSTETTETAETRK